MRIRLTFRPLFPSNKTLKSKIKRKDHKASPYFLRKKSIPTFKLREWSLMSKLSLLFDIYLIFFLILIDMKIVVMGNVIIFESFIQEMDGKRSYYEAKNDHSNMIFLQVK